MLGGTPNPRATRFVDNVVFGRKSSLRRFIVTVYVCFARMWLVNTGTNINLYTNLTGVYVSEMCMN